jgi:hypothetical protein
MKHVTINRNKPARQHTPVQELTPRPDPPALRDTHRIIMSIFGTRFELTRHTEVRVLPKGPAKVIQMPSRRTIEP